MRWVWEMVVDCPTQLICTWIFIVFHDKAKITQQGNLLGEWEGRDKMTCEIMPGLTFLEYFLAIQGRSCKNVQTVRTSQCYFFWPVLIFGKSTQKAGENTRKQAKTRENRRKTSAFLVLIFWGEKLVGANFYAFCNYG